MSQFHNSNLLYRPSLSIWTARKKDKGESARVTETNGAQTGAANVYKALLPDNPKLEAVRKWGDGFRDFIYTNTLPWDDSGWRIGRVDRHMDFMAKAGDKMREGEQLVGEFLAEYAQAIEHARFQLADLFDANDYPGVEEVRGKFRFTLDVTTLPNAEDFRILDGVPQAEVDKLVGIATNSVETRIQAAMDTAYERLFTVVQKMATTLDDFGSGKIKKFNDTLVGNISELVDAMPALNVTGDPKLQALASKARELANYAAADLRKDEAVRKAAMTEAQLLAKEFKPEPVGQPVAPTTSPARQGMAMADTLRDMLAEA